MVNWVVLDAVHLNKLYPEKVKIPTPTEIRKAQIGDYVKIIFEFEEDGKISHEDYWVKLTLIKKDMFNGKVDSWVTAPLPFKFSEVIEFPKAAVTDLLKRKVDFRRLMGM